MPSPLVKDRNAKPLKMAASRSARPTIPAVDSHSTPSVMMMMMMVRTSHGL